MRRLEHEVRLPPQTGEPALDPQRHAGTRCRRRCWPWRSATAPSCARSTRTDIRRLHRRVRHGGATDRDRLRPRPHRRRRPCRGGERDRVRARQRPTRRAAGAGGALGGALRPVVGRAHQVRARLPAGAGAGPRAGGQGRASPSCRPTPGRPTPGPRCCTRHWRRRCPTPPRSPPAPTRPSICTSCAWRCGGCARRCAGLPPGAATPRPRTRWRAEWREPFRRLGAARDSRRAGAQPAAGAGGGRRAALRPGRGCHRRARPGRGRPQRRIHGPAAAHAGVVDAPAAADGGGGSAGAASGRGTTCCAEPGAACCATPQALPPPASKNSTARASGSSAFATAWSS